MNRRALCTSIAVLVLIALPVFEAAIAIPRYSARYRQNCNLCHHNPTGGGMRSLYASQFLVPTEMVIKDFDTERIEAIQPQLSESITIGTDIRTVHHRATEDRPPPERNFFQMQGDLYVRFQVDETFSAYMDRGQSSTLELFGLAYILPYNGYVKFGRFTPAFGWKLADHRQFVRQLLFFEPPRQTDVGIEVGVYPGRLALIAAVVNGESSTGFDTNNTVAYLTRGSYRFHLGPVGFALGGSFRRHEERTGFPVTGGPFWYVNWQRFTWLGEVVWSDLSRETGGSTTALVTSHEWSLQLRPGLDLRLVYNLYDPDLDLKSGIRVKAGGGVDALLTPFFGIKGMLHRYRNDRGLAVSEISYTQSEVTLHLYY